MINRKRYRAFTERPPSSEPASDSDEAKAARRLRAKANVYDAVAGRVTAAGLVGSITDLKASRQPLRPDEVLFKQRNAPIRYEETDYYFAHEKLTTDQQLPSGDLLRALHAYVSKLYSRNPGPETEKAWKCMDETALIAFGILLEETAREKLAETGDLAFTDAADPEEERLMRGEQHEDGRGLSRTTAKDGGVESDSGSSSVEDDTSDGSV